MIGRSIGRSVGWLLIRFEIGLPHLKNNQPRDEEKEMPDQTGLWLTVVTLRDGLYCRDLLINSHPTIWFASLSMCTIA